MSRLSLWLVTGLLALDSKVSGEEASAVTVPSSSSPEEVAATPTPALQITLNGQAFHRADSEQSTAAKTFVYLPSGATLQDWSEMVTHQVITLQQRSGADEVLQFIREKSKARVRLELVLETRKASVFVSLSPGVEGEETQMAVGFAFLDLSDPLQIHLVQFVLKPNRLSQPDVEQKLKSWRDLFKTRATALASS